VLAGATGLLTVLALFDIWDVLRLPIVVALILATALAAAALRDVLPTAIASFHMAAFRPVEVRDYIKLDTGHQGTVESITWREVLLLYLALTHEGNVVRIERDEPSREPAPAGD